MAINRDEVAAIFKTKRERIDICYIFDYMYTYGLLTTAIVGIQDLSAATSPKRPNKALIAAHFHFKNLKISTNTS